MAKFIDPAEIDKPVKKEAKPEAKPEKVRETYHDYRHAMLMLHDDLAEKRAMLREQMKKDRAKKEAK